jgi:MbtH protein
MLHDAAIQFIAVMNDEEQYSLWEAGRDLPPGWHAAGFEGSREDCLRFIDENWLDMRPKSLRMQLEQE